MKCVITYPNNDAGGASTVPILQAYADMHPDRVRLVPSLGMLRYLSMLKIAAVVIGNSSSGIVEVPSAGIPTVDIGIRQRGRTAASSVIHCGNNSSDIVSAIRQALSPEFRAMASQGLNPYFKPDTPALMTEAILHFMDTLPAAPKTFYNIDFTS